MKIVKQLLDESQYFAKEVDKKQIVLHHTVSSDNVLGVINWWNQSPERVGTCYIISHDGTIYQTYNSNLHWAYHLGISDGYLRAKGFGDSTRRVFLNQQSIGIEIINWGFLVKGDNRKFYPAILDGDKYVANPKKYKSVSDVTELDIPYKGFKYYESYTEQQIEAVKELVTKLGNDFNIPLTYKEDKWDVTNDALAGQSGLFYHTSYLNEKSDIYPMPDMKKMLISL